MTCYFHFKHVYVWWSIIFSSPVIFHICGLLLYEIVALVILVKPCYNSFDMPFMNCIFMNCCRLAPTVRELARTLDKSLINDLGYPKRHVRCLQVFCIFSVLSSFQWIMCTLDWNCTVLCMSAIKAWVRDTLDILYFFELLDSIDLKNNSLWWIIDIRDSKQHERSNGLQQEIQGRT